MEEMKFMDLILFIFHLICSLGERMNMIFITNLEIYLTN